MEKLINELKEQERKIKAELEKETEKATLEEIKADFERLKKSLINIAQAKKTTPKKKLFRITTFF